MTFSLLLSECCVSYPTRYEDPASSCTATEFHGLEDGRNFRGTSQGIKSDLQLFWCIFFTFILLHYIDSLSGKVVLLIDDTNLLGNNSVDNILHVATRFNILHTFPHINVGAVFWFFTIQLTFSFAHSTYSLI